jgi:plasmid stabilization system protein ParE
MIGYQFTPRAVDDLFDIWSYIAQDNPEAADRVERAIHAACALLAKNPSAGSVRPDLTSLPLRFWSVQPFRHYLIVYDPETKPLRVIRVLHHARNVPRILS